VLISPDAVVAEHGLPTGPVTLHIDRPTRLVARVGGFAVKADAQPDAFAQERAAIARLAAAARRDPGLVPTPAATDDRLRHADVAGRPPRALRGAR
jgi:hypothetical protein